MQQQISRRADSQQIPLWACTCGWPAQATYFLWSGTGSRAVPQGQGQQKPEAGGLECMVTGSAG